MFLNTCELLGAVSADSALLGFRVRILFTSLFMVENAQPFKLLGAMLAVLVFSGVMSVHMSL